MTIGERRLVRSQFGDALSLDDVRLAGMPWPFQRAFVPGRWFGHDWVLWPAAALPEDFSTAPPSLQAVLIHELVHVWQAQNGVNLLRGKLRAGDARSAYDYPLTPCGWEALNIEQQAMAVQHRFEAVRGFAVPKHAGHYAAICPIEQANSD